mgnify:CR=1 FL=1
MDLNTAVQKHAEWKTKLRSAIAKQQQMDIVTLSRDDCCELGQWLHGEARARFGTILGSTVDQIAPSRRFYAGGGASDEPGPTAPTSIECPDPSTTSPSGGSVDVQPC